MAWLSRNRWKCNASQLSNEYMCAVGEYANVLYAREDLLGHIDETITTPSTSYSFSDADVSSESEMVEGETTNLFVATVTWDQAGSAGENKRNPQRPPPIGQMAVDFQTNGAMAHITSALRGQQVSYAQDPLSGQIDGFDGLINVTKDGVAGCDIIVPQCQMNVRSTFYNQTLSPSYIKTLTELTGTVNSRKLAGHDPGELLFAGAFGSMRWNFDDATETTELGFQFLCTKNVVNLPIGQGDNQFTVASKKGHQYLWIYTKMVIEDEMVKSYKPEIASVATVYDENSWSGLRLPW